MQQVELPAPAARVASGPARKKDLSKAEKRRRKSTGDFRRRVGWPTQTVPCELCSAPFRRVVGTLALYCSEKCRSFSARKRASERRQAQRPSTCIICQSPVVQPRGRGRPRLYCTSHGTVDAIKRRKAEDRQAKFAAMIAEHGSVDAYKLHQMEQRAARHREKVAAWAAANPDKIRATRERQKRMRRSETRIEYARQMASLGILSLVYFITTEKRSAIKIGWHTGCNLRQRVTSMQCGNEDRLIVMGVVHGWNRSHELDLHGRFAADRIRPDGEWFRPSTALLNYIAQHAIPWTDAEEGIRAAG